MLKNLVVIPTQMRASTTVYFTKTSREYDVVIPAQMRASTTFGEALTFVSGQSCHTHSNAGFYNCHCL